MQITKKDLKQLRRNLPRGTAAKIAKKFNIHRNNIYNVLNGTSKNQRIIDELIAEVAAAKLHDNKVTEILNALKDGN